MNFNDKQLHIIMTAEKLFASKGYDGTSVRDIAEEAGVNIAMISYYFGSKEKLMQALFEERTKDIMIKLENLLKDENLSSFEKIGLLVDDYVDRIMYKRQFYKVMVYEQMMEKNPAISTMLYELKKRNAEIISKLIEEGQQKGEFKKDIDLALLINTMVGTALQTFISRDYYRFYHNLQAQEENEFHEQLKKKLSSHIKILFKAILSYEA